MNFGGSKSLQTTAVVKIWYILGGRHRSMRNTSSVNRNLQFKMSCGPGVEGLSISVVYRYKVVALFRRRQMLRVFMRALHSFISLS
jgi:hypothetical protein